MRTKKKIQRVFNYQVIVYSDRTVGSNKPCFTAYCPILGIADSGKTIDEALNNIKRLIRFHLECLKKEKSSIPKGFSAKGEEIITTAKVSVAL